MPSAPKSSTGAASSDLPVSSRCLTLHGWQPSSFPTVTFQPHWVQKSGRLPFAGLPIRAAYPFCCSGFKKSESASELERARRRKTSDSVWQGGYDIVLRLLAGTSNVPHPYTF